MIIMVLLSLLVLFGAILSHVQSAEVGTCTLGQCFPSSDNVEDGSVIDFIIVGAGSAGCVLANRLTENPSVSALLFEAGGDPPLASVVPGMADNMLNTDFDWQFSTASDGYSSQALNGGLVPIPRGKMFGGSSSINSMYFFRGSYKEYDDWCAMGNTGWCYKDVLPYFRKIETITNENVALNPNFWMYRGTKGPEKITKMYNYGNVTELFRKGYQQVGIPYNPDVNGASPMGYVLADVDVYGGERQSAAYSYITPIISRPNLMVLKNTFVYKIIFDVMKKKAIGVEYLTNGGCNKRAFAAKEVIVSAGTIGSAQLLMMSGVGPSSVLKSNNINCIADLPVGKNFQDHPSIPIVISATENLEPNMNFNLDIAMQQYLVNRTGFYSYPPDVTVAAFVSLTNNSYPDYENQVFYSPPGGSTASGLFTGWNFNQTIVRQVENFNKNKNVIVFLVILLEPSSRGQMYLNPYCVSGKPVVYNGFFSNSSDLDVTVKSIKRAIKIANTEAFKKIGAKLEYIDVPQCKLFRPGSDDYWRCYALNMATTAYHPAGTCKMGSYDDDKSVVDPTLRVKGINNLRVIDASIMPTEPRCNINNPTLMIAEKGADLIKKHNQC